MNFICMSKTKIGGLPLVNNNLVSISSRWVKFFLKNQGGFYRVLRFWLWYRLLWKTVTSLCSLENEWFIRRCFNFSNFNCGKALFLTKLKLPYILSYFYETSMTLEDSDLWVITSIRDLESEILISVFLQNKVLTTRKCQNIFQLSRIILL